MKDKVIQFLYIILYYIIIVGIFIFAGGYEAINGIIGDFSYKLFIYCYAIIPIIFLVIPFIIKKIFNKNIIKSIIYSSITIVFYIVIILNGIKFGINTYISRFTPEKWDKYEYLRYLMMNDLMEKYEFSGMTRGEVYSLLGENSPEDNVISYHIRTSWLEVYYFVIHFDKNDTVIGFYVDY